MFIFRTQKGTVILQIICLIVNILMGQCENIEAVINVRMEPTSNNYVQAAINDANYKRLKDYLSNTSTSTVYLYYGYASDWIDYYITFVNRHVPNYAYYPGLSSTFLYFHCSVNLVSTTIHCNRDVRCNNTFTNYCPNGFGIAWHYGSEYLFSEYLQNNTVYCAGGDTVTCYRLKNMSTPTTTITSTTTTTSSKLTTVNSTKAQFSTESSKDTISTSLYTFLSSNSSFKSTIYLNSYSTERTSSDSTAVIAGATVGVVIACIVVVIIIVILIKRNVKKEAARVKEISNPCPEMVNSSFSGSIYTELVLNFDGHDNIKSTCSNATNNEQYTLCNSIYKNNYTHTLSNGNTPNSVSQSISHSDYNTIDDKRGNAVSRPVTTDVEDINCFTEISYSDANKLHPVVEYSTVNENGGYKNVNEIRQNEDLASVHEYNNITDINTTIGKTEPAKNVYSKLRENIPHFDNAYGDVGVTLQTGVDNSTQARENTYFILEAEENDN